LIAVGVLLLGLIALGVWRFTSDKQAEALDDETSEAADMKYVFKGTKDGFFGYHILESKRFRKELRRSKLAVKWNDDGADYTARAQAMADSKFDFNVATVDSEILNAAPHKYPSRIGMVIDVSNGGDCVYSREDFGKVPKDFEGKDLRVGFTTNSPSEHLGKVLRGDMGIESLLPKSGAYRVEANGSEHVFELFEAGKIDVGYMWEPQCSFAAKLSGAVKIFDSSQVSDYIVDVLMFTKEFLGRDDSPNRKLAVEFVAAYFRALKWYRDHPDDLVKEVQTLKGNEKLTEADVKNMLAGIDWQTLTDNATYWFDISKGGEESNLNIEYVINNTVDVLIRNGDFSSNPLPDESAYELFFGDIIEEVYQKSSTLMTAGKTKKTGDTLTAEFTELPQEAWDELGDAADLKMPRINFRSGTALLTFDGKQTCDALAGKLRVHDSSRVVVTGHTDSRGDAAKNQALSLLRAQAVVSYMKAVHSVSEHRFLAVGKGGAEPKGCPSDASRRRCLLLQRRVEFTFKQEVY
jgi:outer membrane protein OmpA-like peptidoglycan-associated protein/ABC-type nitrate/sulfonate/bicarbonate transport system substrate-binding protein